MKKSFALSVIFLTACQSVPTPLITAPPQANAAQLVQDKPISYAFILFRSSFV
jgi:uncharacterized lipoprotein YajG